MWTAIKPYAIVLSDANASVCFPPGIEIILHTLYINSSKK